MSKDNINIKSPITIDKIVNSPITEEKVIGSRITTNLIIKSPIGIEDVFVSEYQNVMDSWTTLPDADVQTAQNAWVADLVAKNLWLTKDVRYVFAAHTNDNGEALTNWISPGTFDAVMVNNPGFVAFEGFDGDGATQYIDINWNPSVSAVNYLLNSASMSIYIRNDINVSGGHGVHNSGFGNTAIFPRQGGKYFSRVNTATWDSVATPDSLGMYVGNREAVSAITLYKNKVALNTGTVVSILVPEFDPYALAYSSNGVASGFTTHQVAYYDFGGSMTQQDVDDEYDGFQAYMTSNGKEV